MFENVVCVKKHILKNHSLDFKCRCHEGAASGHAPASANAPGASSRWQYHESKKKYEKAWAAAARSEAILWAARRGGSEPPFCFVGRERDERHDSAVLVF